jgi:hypothetical protein
MEHPVVSSLLRTMIIASDLPHPQQQHFLIDHDRHKVAYLLQALAISLGSHHIIKLSHNQNLPPPSIAFAVLPRHATDQGS